MKRSSAVFILFSALLLSSFSLLSSPYSARAQGIPISIASIDLSVSNDSPSPGDTVTITAKSYSIDIVSSKITWSVGGVTKQSGIGKTTLEVQAPALGKKLDVSVTAVTTTGTSVSGTISITSGSVDMILETDGYVPAFFRGKVAPAYQNSVTVIAIPHIADSSGKEYDPKTLVYSWKKSNQALADMSGYGKQSVTMKGAIVPRPYTIEVVVSTRDGGAQSKGMISVTPQSPSLYFYVNDPLYGTLLNRAITGSVRIGGEKETGVLAVPYGFNKPANSLGDLTFNWLINGSERSDLSSKASVVLRAPDGQAGSSNIELNVGNTKEILQGAQADFRAIYSAADSNASSDSVNF